MKPSNSEWHRIVSAARRAPDDREIVSPYGFSTRAVAQSQVYIRGKETNTLARFSWRALGVAALVMATTVAATFQPLMNRLADDAAVLSDPMPDPEESAL